MPTFQYKALQADGTIAEGQLEAAGRQERFGKWRRSACGRSAWRKRPAAKNGAEERLGPAGGLEGLGNISFKFKSHKVSAQGAGELHAAAVEPAGGGRAAEPRAGDSAQGSLLAGRAGEVEGNPRPGRGRHVAGRRDGEIAGDLSARLYGDGAGGRDGRISGRGAGADRRLSGAREGPAIEGDDGDALSVHPVGARAGRADLPADVLHPELPAGVRELPRFAAADHADHHRRQPSWCAATVCSWRWGSWSSAFCCAPGSPRKRAGASGRA